MNQILYQRLKSSLNSHLIPLALLFFTLLTPQCTTKDKQEKLEVINEVKLIPAPNKLLYKRGVFKLEKTTRVLLNLSDKKSKTQGEYLLAKLKGKTGYTIKIADRFTTSKIKSSIELITDNTAQNLPESYKIEIKASNIRIYANDINGLFYAINTLVELFNKKTTTTWQAPQLLIEDYPRARVRVLQINVDSIPYSESDFIEMLQLNRFNHFQSNQHFNTALNYIKVSKGLHTDTPKQSIKSFYSSAHKTDTLVFTITNPNQLHADSLKILGEAMWSKTSKLNYSKLMLSLTNELN